MIDLRDDAIHTILEARRGGKIAATWTSRIIAGNRKIRCWPGIALEQRGNYRIWISIRCIIGCNLLWIRNAAQSGLCASFTLSFVIDIEERAILDDRSAERSTKLIVVERILPAHVIKDIARAHLTSA